MKILVLPDIHGRTFWKEPCNNIDEYEKIIFLGDYLDPYSHEEISVEDAIVNFEDIIDFAKKHRDKVVLLLGNHDLPYASEYYYRLNRWHCRHAYDFHNDIHNLFEENKELFNIAYYYNDVLYTHAGCSPVWLSEVNEILPFTNIKDLEDSLNTLLLDKRGLECLYMVGYERGGNDNAGSCIWADVRELHDYVITYKKLKEKGLVKNPFSYILDTKQIFGHTQIASENPIEFETLKMLDNRAAYELNDDFKVNKI